MQQNEKVDQKLPVIFLEWRKLLTKTTEKIANQTAKLTNGVFIPVKEQKATSK